MNVNIKENKSQKIVDEINGEKYEGLFKSLYKRDYMFMGIITAVYAVIAFIHLGNAYGPETMWNANSTGEEVIVDFWVQKSHFNISN